MREAGGRYETCVICGLSWNVSKDLRIRYPGYICPHCTGKERSPHNDTPQKPAASPRDPDVRHGQGAGVRRRHKRGSLRLRCFAIGAAAVVLVAFSLASVNGTEDNLVRTAPPGQEMAATTMQHRAEAAPTAEPQPTREPAPPSPFTEADVELLAELMTAEAEVVKWDGERWGVSAYARIAAVGWVVLNRYDEGGATFEEVIKSPHQFAWREGIEAPADLKWLAADVLARYWAEKNGKVDAGRTLPASYLFFHGDGRENYFREEYISTGDYWDWSLPDPYKEAA